MTIAEDNVNATNGGDMLNGTVLVLSNWSLPNTTDGKQRKETWGSYYGGENEGMGRTKLEREMNLTNRQNAMVHKNLHSEYSSKSKKQSEISNPSYPDNLTVSSDYITTFSTFIESNITESSEQLSKSPTSTDDISVTTPVMSTSSYSNGSISTINVTPPSVNQTRIDTSLTSPQNDRQNRTLVETLKIYPSTNEVASKSSKEKSINDRVLSSSSPPPPTQNSLLPSQPATKGTQKPIAERRVNNSRFSKRKIRDKDFRASQTPTPSNTHTPHSLLRPPTAPVASKDICKDDPCGPGIPCHPTTNSARGFECICPDKTKVDPGDKCPSRTLDYTPLPQPIPTKTYKLHDQQPTESGGISLIKSRNVIGLVLGTFVLLMVFLAVSCWKRKTISSVMKIIYRDEKTDSSPGTKMVGNIASNPIYKLYPPSDNLPLQTLAVQYIDTEQITFVGELGEGCFGKVYKGEYGPRCPENILNKENASGSSPKLSVTVAVKVLKDCAGVEAEADFMREVEIMSAFRHDNILSLIGIVATENGVTPWMVFEYMPYGDLAEVLRSCNKQFYLNDTNKISLGKDNLLNMSVQIASGMEYLSSQHFVHRDLACRNCLVGENLCVKISDFGMSRDVYTCDYYKVGGSRMLPVRWMSPESIMYGKFTLESDVWSFGVVLWEIYSFGKQPYYGNSNENVVKLILQGILLNPTNTCPPQVCDVMRRCWSTDPQDRIKFPEILAALTRFSESNPEVTPPLTPTAHGPSITYSELCMHEDTDSHMDADQYLMPKQTEIREYLTVLSEV